MHFVQRFHLVIKTHLNSGLPPFVPLLNPPLATEEMISPTTWIIIVW